MGELMFSAPPGTLAGFQSAPINTRSLRSGAPTGNHKRNHVWNSMGVAGGGTVQGKTMTAQECFYNAVKEDPEDHSAWLNLAAGGGHADCSKKGCLIKAVELKPDAKSSSEAWNSLGFLGGGEVLGQSYSQKECYQKSVQCNPENLVAKTNKRAAAKDENVKMRLSTRSKRTVTQVKSNRYLAQAQNA